MERIFKAFINSMRSLNHLARHEKPVQQELVLLLVSLPVAWFVAADMAAYLLLVGAVLFLLLVEVINTSVEATCNAISRDFKKDIQIAKDAGSLAVLIASIMCATVWIYHLWPLVRPLIFSA
ncbi:diacylglycerol kinase [Pseudochrobactrum sp. Wa41.01b-1]|uniref:diacylglycerol kinase n=1 Tax=Pseudochrobactrum sp. Wa41.01b-1 TaxID=2864102 RepID=UPI001C688C77|nr:diacylglycerol kinase [Pseudochrobactrum sp. Wa41.01b-1]QYM73037.1 diacylglycerol kinase [Pseudochrobactrum sp. Wa41.01b-1]